MESYRMTVVCRPDLSTLARIVAVLHARHAGVSALHYDRGPLGAELTMQVAGADDGRLAEQLGRVVDVTDVQRATVARIAVAS
jgi:acetolactate synthase regulatory subunit